MSLEKWIKLTVKYDNSKCIQCGEIIPKGDMALWLKGLGVKHEECNLPNEKDNTELIIEDEPTGFCKRCGCIMPFENGKCHYCTNHRK